VSILADTSGLLALLDEKNRYYQPALAYVNQLIIPVPVITELDYLATKLLGARAMNIFYFAQRRYAFPCCGYDGHSKGI
jgi:hypothetical protein